MDIDDLHQKNSFTFWDNVDIEYEKLIIKK